MNKILPFVAVALILGIFYSMAFVGVETVGGFGGSELAAENEALTNLSNDITELLIDIIPIFIILGVFGAVISHVGKLSKGMG